MPLDVFLSINFLFIPVSCFFFVSVKTSTSTKQYQFHIVTMKKLAITKPSIFLILNHIKVTQFIWLVLPEQSSRLQYPRIISIFSWNFANCNFAIKIAPKSQKSVQKYLICITPIFYICIPRGHWKLSDKNKQAL